MFTEGSQENFGENVRRTKWQESIDSKKEDEAAGQARLQNTKYSRLDVSKGGP